MSFMRLHNVTQRYDDHFGLRETHFRLRAGLTERSRPAS